MAANSRTKNIILAAGLSIPAALVVIALAGIAAAIAVVGDWSDSEGNVGEPDIVDSED